MEYPFFSFFVVAQLFPSVDGEKLFPFPKIVGFAQQTFLFPLPSGKIIPQILNLVSFPLFFIFGTIFVFLPLVIDQKILDSGIIRIDSYFLNIGTVPTFCVVTYI